ncbi:MAG: hypothetical protein K0R73_928 [Candidatus Midichloriaceae bacterium]|jgi:hypothetical protein|nr:hypothetical protein [Candidatus Midichloriaceae bacterium]
MNGSDDKKARGNLKDMKGFAKKKDVLDKFFTDRKIESTKAFTNKGAKQKGQAAGYVAKRNSDERTFLLKSALLKNDDSNDAGREKIRQIMDRRDLVNEYVIAPLYQRLLFDRAPIFELTVDTEIDNNKEGTPKVDKSNNGMIYGRSKFFDDFQTLADFQKSSDQEMEGFEKVMAACLFAGDGDYHNQNLGVVSKDGKNIVVKIDHGKAGMISYESTYHLFERLKQELIGFGYSKIPFKITEFKRAIDEMVKISDDEIEAMIDSRIDKLVKAGFKFENTKFISMSGAKLDPSPHVFNGGRRDDKDATVEIKNSRDIDKLKKFYLQKFKKNRDLLKEVSIKLEWMSKIEIPEDQRSNNLLIQIGGEDPLVYAAKKGFKVDGKDAQEFLPDLMKKQVYYYMKASNEKDYSRFNRALQKYIEIKEILGYRGLVDIEDPNNIVTRDIAKVRDSALAKFLNSAPSFVIAEKLGAVIGESADKTTEIDLELLKHYDIDVMARVVKVMNHIDKGLEDRPLTYYLHKFLECINNAIGLGATDKLLIAAQKELEEIFNKEKATERNQKNGFVDKVFKTAEEKGPSKAR